MEDAAAAVTFLLEKVKAVLKWHKDLISGAENEVECLKMDLCLLEAFLHETGKHESKEDKIWSKMESEIKKVVYEVEDTIDTSLIVTTTTTTAANTNYSILRSSGSLAEEVNSFRQEKVKPILDNVIKKVTTHGLGTCASTSMDELAPTRVKKDMRIGQDKYVGLEEQEKFIITNFIQLQTEELDVTSIIGWPGFGKTTLARMIYHNKTVDFEFPVRIWVSTRSLNMKDVFLNILKKFTSQDKSGLDEDDLIQTVRKHLEQTKFFLVLDVRSVEDWNAIRVVLPKTNRTSKVLITSYDREVGRLANLDRQPHMLRRLTVGQSWELLQLKVFGKLDAVPDPELGRIGESIALESIGAPCLIVIYAGILWNKYSTTRPMTANINDWEDVLYKLRENVPRNHTLMLSTAEYIFSILPNGLKDCFLYLGVFPEEYVIQAWTLTRLWIAEGFIQHKQGQSLEETAEENLKELISWNLVVVEKINSHGKVAECRISNTVRECIFEARYTEQQLFDQIRLINGFYRPTVSEIQNCRRLCIHSDLPYFLSTQPKGPRLRSFLCFNKEPLELDPHYQRTISDAFNLLRVLDSKSIRFYRFPIRVTKLIHLRYLTLCIDLLTVLPEPISQLWNLQTLVIDTYSHSITMKANMWRMMQLRHLKTKAAIVLDDTRWEGGEAGENLQTLTALSPESWTPDVCKRAPNLKTLGFYGKLANLFNSSMSMENLFPLEKLKLTNSEDRLHGLPQSNCFPPYLKSLTLSNTFLDWEHMAILAKIDTLEVLKLKDDAFTGDSWNAVGAGFPNLQFLLIANTDLVHWKASTNHFPGLRCLVLKNCEKLKEIPGALAENLERLDIDWLQKSAVDSAKRIEVEKNQVQEQQKAKLGVGFKLLIGPGCE